MSDCDARSWRDITFSTGLMAARPACGTPPCCAATIIAMFTSSGMSSSSVQTRDRGSAIQAVGRWRLCPSDQRRPHSAGPCSVRRTRRLPSVPPPSPVLGTVHPWTTDGSSVIWRPAISCPEASGRQDRGIDIASFGGQHEKPPRQPRQLRGNRGSDRDPAVVREESGYGVATATGRRGGGQSGSERSRG